MLNHEGSTSSVHATAFADAYTWLSQQGEAILQEQIELANVPSPPFQEHTRAEVLRAKLLTIGVTPASDEIGNVLAEYPAAPGETSRSPVIIAAHLDTVFGPHTPIAIRSVGPRWVGPGITDNARGLAVSLAVLRALVRGELAPRHPLIFAFTVGEEGRGDLRGVKHLFAEGSPLRNAEAFIAVDGSGLGRIVHHALGSRRFRITVEGGGGHSWSNWGRSNPANAVGDLIHRLTALALPDDPRTTLTVARLGGGISINAIPAECWVELDLRSLSNATLLNIESRIRDALFESIATEKARGDGVLSSRFELIGERPAGSLSASHDLVQAASQATRSFGVEPEYAVSSTDANIPLALGIPAVAIGGGGESGETHTENEWFEDTNGASGSLRLLSLLAAVAGFGAQHPR
jgi:acetylornithine deacetylase/succinyl-diaminopimelate desuccinylase-like protein